MEEENRFLAWREKERCNWFDLFADTESDEDEPRDDVVGRG
jgi:hypothetical protein